MDGDASAFDALYRRHVRAVTGYCRRLLGRAEVAEEIAVDTFETVARGRYEPTGSLKSYLFTVAHRRCLDVLRRRATRERLRPTLQVVTDVPRSPEDVVVLDDDVQRMEAMLHRIPEAHRAVLLLYYRQHLSVREVAEVVGITTEQVKTKLAYARRLLRRHMEVG